MTEGEEGKLDEVDRNGTPVMGIGLWGLSPLCEIGISRRSVYQMTTSREQARGEGDCGRVSKLAHLRKAAAALLCVEPTRLSRMPWWCGEGARQRAGLSDIRRLSKCPVMVDGRLLEILRCSE